MLTEVDLQYTNRLRSLVKEMILGQKLSRFFVLAIAAYFDNLFRIDGVVIS